MCTESETKQPPESSRAKQDSCVSRGVPDVVGTKLVRCEITGRAGKTRSAAKKLFTGGQGLLHRRSLAEPHDPSLRQRVVPASNPAAARRPTSSGRIRSCSAHDRRSILLATTSTNSSSPVSESRSACESGSLVHRLAERSVAHGYRLPTVRRRITPADCLVLPALAHSSGCTRSSSSSSPSKSVSRSAIAASRYDAEGLE